MENLFFDSDFRFDKYLGDRLLEISDEGERRALKDVMSKTMLPFYELVEGKYRELSERLLTGTAVRGSSFDLITGIASRNKIDVTEDAMYPMNYGDLSDVMVDSGEMMEKVKAGRPYTIFRVFLQADAAVLRKLEKEMRHFRGTIYTQTEEYRTEVRLVRNQSYQTQIAGLYPLFENNGIKWKTVNMPYLSKFYDVQVLRSDCSDRETIQRFQIDFEEYARYVRYDVIPVWNVRFLSEKTGAYPDLALDRVHYEHCIYRSHFLEGREYLVAEEGIRLWDIFLQDGDMHIVCEEKNPRAWKLMEVNQKALKGVNEFPVYQNGAREALPVNCIHTKAEIKRFLDCLSCDDLALEDVVIKNDLDATEVKTYSMDAFIEDEIRTCKNRQALVFRFRAKDPGHYLNYDLMSYLISRVQWELPEFYCVGELI